MKGQSSGYKEGSGSEKMGLNLKLIKVSGLLSKHVALVSQSLDTGFAFES